MTTQTNTTLTDAEFCRALLLLKNEWDRCMNVMRRAGFTEEEAAKATGKSMTEWFANRHTL